MPDTETEEFTIDELKKQFADIGLVKAICDYMKGAKGTPMNLYVTLAGVLGVALGEHCSSEDDLKQMLGVIGDLIISAATHRFERKNAEEPTSSTH